MRTGEEDDDEGNDDDNNDDDHHYRFWFENKENGLFTDDEVAALRKLKLSDIIHAVTDIRKGDIQKNVFMWQQGDPCPQPHQLNATEMDPCMFLKGKPEVKRHRLSFFSLQVTTTSKAQRFHTYLAASS